LRRRGKNSKVFEPVKKKKKIQRFISGFQARTSKNRIKSKSSEDSNPNLRIKPGEKSKTYLFMLKNINEPEST